MQLPRGLHLRSGLVQGRPPLHGREDKGHGEVHGHGRQDHEAQGEGVGGGVVVVVAVVANVFFLVKNGSHV